MTFPVRAPYTRDQLDAESSSWPDGRDPLITGTARSEGAVPITDERRRQARFAAMLTRLRLRPRAGTITAWRTASLGGAVVAVLIVVGVLVTSSQGFRDAFGSNFLATVAGIALGVPIAVWLTLREADELGKAARAQEEVRSAARRGEVLVAIRRELAENKTILGERSQDGKRNLAVPFLQDEVWAAMSDGGELRWVNDPDLLRQVARAYVFVRTNIFLERRAFEIIHYPGMRIQGHDPEKRILDYLNNLDHVVTAAMDEAIAAIDSVVGPAPDPVGTIEPPRS